MSMTILPFTWRCYRTSSPVRTLPTAKMGIISLRPGRWLGSSFTPLLRLPLQSAGSSTTKLSATQTTQRCKKWHRHLTAPRNLWLCSLADGIYSSPVLEGSCLRSSLTFFCFFLFRCSLSASRGGEIGWIPEYRAEHILEVADAEVELILKHI